MTQMKKEVPIYQYVGGYLKRELKRRNWSQAYFAEKVGVDDRTVRRWISEGVHSLDVTCEIADRLGVSVRDIFLDEDGVPFHFFIWKPIGLFAPYRFPFSCGRIKSSTNRIHYQ